MSQNPQRKTHRNSKQTYFSSPKKELLVKKMILDFHEAFIPSSCYEPRPLNECSESQHQVILEEKDSSMKQISYCEKGNSLYLIDEVIEDGQTHLNHTFLTNYDKNILENHSEQSQQQESSPLKRSRPTFQQSISNYDVKVKIFHEIEQQTPVKRQEIYFDSQRREKKSRMSSRIISEDQLYDDISERMSEQQEGEQDFDYPSISSLQSERQKRQDKSKTRRVCTISDNEDFAHVNQFVELMSYSSLIEEMILIYDKSPLFVEPVDFDSQSQTGEEFHQNSSNHQPDQSQHNYSSKIQEQNESPKVKFEQIYQQQQNSINMSNGNNNIESMINQMKLNSKGYSGYKTKQKWFEQTKTFINFSESVEKLKPFIKKITQQEKNMFLQFKKELRQIKDIIDHFDKKNSKNSEHVCKICGEYFDNGRQLGGHMSRKHPGKAFEYGLKKQLHKVKAIERNRRLYFKRTKL